MITQLHDHMITHVMQFVDRDKRTSQTGDAVFRLEAVATARATHTKRAPGFVTPRRAGARQAGGGTFAILRPWRDGRILSLSYSLSLVLALGTRSPRKWDS